MMILIHRTNSRAELREMPSARPIASGSLDAVVAAADLIAGRGGWRIESMNEAAHREIAEFEDQRVFEFPR